MELITTSRESLDYVGTIIAKIFVENNFEPGFALACLPTIGTILLASSLSLVNGGSIENIEKKLREGYEVYKQTKDKSPEEIQQILDELSGERSFEA